MIVEDDIGRLFAIMRSSYGRQWTLGAEDVPVWLAKLKHYDSRQIKMAASKAIDAYTEYPPSLGQFIATVRASMPRPTTLLLPGPFDQANADRAWEHMEKLSGKKLRPK
ncbi:MAG: hypothetical protein E4H01_00315 [Lysobacterales bacterium]|nr:MAG: hypothetical protein E4H01_00315 [Xanthomonadales bacterium]